MHRLLTTYISHTLSFACWRRQHIIQKSIFHLIIRQQMTLPTTYSYPYEVAQPALQ